MGGQWNGKKRECVNSTHMGNVDWDSAVDVDSRLAGYPLWEIDEYTHKGKPRFFLRKRGFDD